MDQNNAGENENPDADAQSVAASALSSRGAEQSESEDDEEAALLFNIKLDRAEPPGTSIGKKSNLCVHIQADHNVMAKEDYLQQKMLEYIL